MHILLLFNGLITLLASVVHAVIGDQEYRKIKPPNDDPILLRLWLQGRCGWHMANWDLLAFGSLFTYLAFYDINFEEILLTIGGCYFIGYALFWLGILIFSRAPGRFYWQLGQWGLLLLIGILALLSR